MRVLIAATIGALLPSTFASAANYEVHPVQAANNGAAVTFDFWATVLDNTAGALYSCVAVVSGIENSGTVGPPTVKCSMDTSFKSTLNPSPDIVSTVQGTASFGSGLSPITEVGYGRSIRPLVSCHFVRRRCTTPEIHRPVASR